MSTTDSRKSQDTNSQEDIPYEMRNGYVVLLPNTDTEEEKEST